MPRRKQTHKACSVGCNNGNPIPREKFSKNQLNCKDSKCIDCIATRQGPSSSRNQKRKASNDAALAAQQNAEEVKDKLAEAMKSKANEATISALEKEKEAADAAAEDARKKSYNVKQNDCRKKSNDAALAARKNAEEVQDKLAEAMVTDADEETISALRKEVEAADAAAEDARRMSRNGKASDCRKKSNDDALAARKNAEEVQDKLAEAMKSKADEATISALRKEVEAADAAAEDARRMSRNGKQNDRRNIKTFPSGFVLDKRTMYGGLSDLITNQKANSTQPSRRALEIRSIIRNGLKKGQSIDDVARDLNHSSML